MKKRGFLVLVFLFNLALINAQTDDSFFSSERLVIDVAVSSEAEIVPTQSAYDIDYIKVNLSHYPYESFNQKVLSFDFQPKAEAQNNALLFEWSNPSAKDISFGYSAKIETTNSIIKIKEKIPFPIIGLPEDLRQYTAPQQVIDSENKDIIKLASTLVSGENDLYVAVHKLGEWTKDNIDYNLSTLTAEVSQQASWVLANRQGVCDELTSLFIAMLRSVGIPAKFISGIAYTNSPLFPENWGSHGWAEVYFPGYGWVPYDVTYGQLGYIDPTHIKLKEAADSAEPSVQYRWLSRNVQLKTNKLDIKASVSEAVGKAKESISIEVRPLREEVRFGSYNLVEVLLENLEDSYTTTEIYISKPKELELQGNFNRNILLKPKERKSIFWVLKVPANLEDNFVYTFPITITTLRNHTKSLSITSKKQGFHYSSGQISGILAQKKEEEENVYSKEVDIDCSVDKNESYPYDEVSVRCNVKNLGNIFLEGLDLCLKEDCSNFDLGIAREKSLNYSIRQLAPGKQELALQLKSQDVSKAEYLEIDVLDEPKIKIDSVEFPLSVSYDESFKIVFMLAKASASNPQEIDISLSQNSFEKTWFIDELPDSQQFVINLEGKNLRKGLNDFSVHINYKDKNDKIYETSDSFSIELSNVTLVQSVLLSVNHFIGNPKSLLVISIVALAFFLAVVWFVFRIRK